MVNRKTETMEEYLRPTELCDCDNPHLIEKAREVTKEAKTPKGAARRIFYFVRDEILFGGYRLYAKASHILKKRRGVCSHKTSLQIALLRASGIPARCHYVRVKREVLKHITYGYLYNRVPAVIGHTWCECYLSGEWLACEALFDEALFKGMLKEGLVAEEQISTIDWDGESNFTLINPWIVEDVGTFPSLDDAIGEMVRKGEKMPSRILDKLFGWFDFTIANKIRKR